MQQLTQSQIERQGLIEALGISNYSEAFQAEIIAKFGEILFKKLLLILPDTVALSTMKEITMLPLEEGMKRLIEQIDTSLPDGQQRRSKTLAETIETLKLRKAKA